MAKRKSHVVSLRTFNEKKSQLPLPLFVSGRSVRAGKSDIEKDNVIPNFNFKFHMKGKLILLIFIEGNLPLTLNFWFVILAFDVIFLT